MQNSILKRFICLFSSFVILLSIFNVLFSNKHKVLADEVSSNISFTSSNIFIPNTDTSQTPFFFNFSYNYISSSTIHKNVDFTFNVSYLDDEDELTSLTFNTIRIKRYTSDTSFSTTEVNNTNTISLLFSSSSIRWEIDTFGFFVNTNSSVDICGFTLVIDSSFVTDFLPYSLNIYGDSSSSSNYLKYVSSDNLYSLVFEFSSDYLFFNSRTYYFGFGADYDDGYSDGLIAGKEDGFRDGYNKGESVGYERGFSDGEDYGIQIGQEQGGNYTFLSLMGAVVDAPLQAVKGLLDFKVFNFDVVNLFYGLVTISVLLVILKYVI